MPPPNDDDVFPRDVHLVRRGNGGLPPSNELVKLLVNARSEYSWPEHVGARKSQQTIIDLESSVAVLLGNLNPINAQEICLRVSDWAGNNAPALAAIQNATPTTRERMHLAISLLGSPEGLDVGLKALSNLPGISLVIASKVYRFCYPEGGASIDRHASYFFNSLDIVDPGNDRTKATHFGREWANGRHTASRLATFNNTGLTRNLKEFLENYLPLLSKIAVGLNALPALFRCSGTGELKYWRPTDVEMAAYYWWAQHGPR